MIAAFAFAMIQASVATEALPIDAKMVEYEAAFPRLAEIQAQTEAEIGTLGSVEAGWSTTGMSLASVIVALGGHPAQHVLGEWEQGGHGVVTSGDRPLSVPPGFRRYIVRAYDGQVDYHSYHRLSPGIVIHIFGSVTRIGNAGCSARQGIELISHEPWQSWSIETGLSAFGVARVTRDDTRTYCTIYRPGDSGRILPMAYTPEGQPFVTLNGDRQTYALTSYDEAATRIFANQVSSPPSD